LSLAILFLAIRGQEIVEFSVNLLKYVPIYFIE
jgi:hypothetical protein